MSTVIAEDPHHRHVVVHSILRLDRSGPRVDRAVDEGGRISQDCHNCLPPESVLQVRLLRGIRLRLGSLLHLRVVHGVVS